MNEGAHLNLYRVRNFNVKQLYQTTQRGDRSKRKSKAAQLLRKERERE